LQVASLYESLLNVPCTSPVLILKILGSFNFKSLVNLIIFLPFTNFNNSILNLAASVISLGVFSLVFGKSTSVNEFRAAPVSSSGSYILNLFSFDI